MKLSLVPTHVPLTLETSEGDIELVISKFTIQDAERRQALMSSVFDDKNATELDKYNSVQFARIMCSVKHKDTGLYYWNKGIADFKSNGYEMDFINALSAAVDEVNPLFIPSTDENGKTEKALDAKKKRS